MVGVDFIQRTTRSFEKHIDVAKSKLGTADLFTRAPIESCPAFAADEVGAPNLQRGQELNVEVSSDALVLRQGLTIVARSESPPESIFQAVQDSCGIATAIVQEVHDISGVIEVTLC